MTTPDFNKSKGAVLYTRVSTGDQDKNGTSPETQLSACRARALAEGLPVVAQYHDGGISGGFLLTRAGMQAALADIQAGRADTLICANISRYSRDTEHQQAIKKAVKAAGGHLVFCDMAFDDTPEGDLAFGVMGTFAEYERKVIRQRTMRGKRKRAEEGQQPQRSRSPYGYHIVTNAEVAAGLHPAHLRGRYLVLEPMAGMVRRIFADYHSGAFSLSALCLALNREGVATPGHGRAWQEATLRVILMNPVYKGEPVSGRQKCVTDESRIGQRHKLTGRPIRTPYTRTLAPPDDLLTLSAPPLVDAEVWEAVQSRLTRMSGEGGGSPRQVRMLSGHTVCPYCGGKAGIKYQKANGKRYRYFTCNQHKQARRGHEGSPCRGELYPVETVEQAVLQSLRDAWQKPAAVQAALHVYTEPMPLNKRTGEDAETRKALDDLKVEEQATAQAQVAAIRAGASPDAFAPLFADIAARRKALLAQQQPAAMSGAADETGKPGRAGRKSTNVDLKMACLAMEEAWRVLTSEGVEGHVKRDLLLTLVEKVICHKDGAEVVFLPGVFGDAGEGDGVSTLYTTCIGIRTHR